MDPSSNRVPPGANTFNNFPFPPQAAQQTPQHQPQTQQYSLFSGGASQPTYAPQQQQWQPTRSTGPQQYEVPNSVQGKFVSMNICL